MTIEDPDEMNEGEEEEDYYLNIQAVLGSREEAGSAYDENGDFHCINWFDCQHCPAFNPNYCI